MTIRRLTEKVPLTPLAQVPQSAGGNDPEKYYYRIDLFYDDSWGLSTSRPLALHFAGAGLSTPYSKTTDWAVKWAEQGYMFGCIYYYQYNFHDDEWNQEDIDNSGYIEPPITKKPYWNEDTGWTRNYESHLIQRAYMAQSGLEWLVNRGNNYPNKFKLDVNNIYFTSKSRGGATLMAWSALSYCFGFRDYKDYCKGIVVSNGFIGSATMPDGSGGWLNWHKTVQAQSHFMSFAQHTFYYAYNELDVGNFDLSARMKQSIPLSDLGKHYFMDFTDMGHTTNLEYNIAAVNAMKNKNRCVINDVEVLSLKEQYDNIRLPKEY